MTQPGQFPEPPRARAWPAEPPDPAAVSGPRGGAARFGGATAALLGTAAASALIGLLTGLIWAAVAPRALLIVQSRGAAYLVNVESSAYIAADAWFCLLTAIGGVVCGVAGYFLAVRRYGAIAVTGIVLGGVAASALAMWAGQQQGLAGFRSALLSRPAGSLLHEPLSLGGRGALAFWPLLAALVVGTIELVSQSVDRKRAEQAQTAQAPAAQAHTAQAPTAQAPTAQAPTAQAPTAQPPGPGPDGSEPGSAGAGSS
jgi:hypothetical protein